MRCDTVMDGLEENRRVSRSFFKVGTCGAILGGITGTWELTRRCGTITGSGFMIRFADEEKFIGRWVLGS